MSLKAENVVIYSSGLAAAEFSLKPVSRDSYLQSIFYEQDFSLRRMVSSQCSSAVLQLL